jgi:hypothetical protein
VSVRQTVGQFEILVIIDCKDYVNPVDVKDVEEFLGLVEDVGANKGALVCPTGFSEAAKTRAKDGGVDLFSLVDAEDEDWRTYVAIPVVCDFRGFGSGRFKIGCSNAIRDELAREDPKLIRLYDEEHKYMGTPLTVLWAMWNRREISEDPGTRNVLLQPNHIFVQASDGHFERVEIIGEFAVVAKLYFGELPLTRISGFKDEIKGSLVLPGRTEIITDWIDTVEVEAHWQRIPSIESLAVKPFMVLTAFDIYPASLPIGSDAESLGSA